MGIPHPKKGPATRPWVGAVRLLLAAGAIFLVGCGSSGGGTDQTSPASGGGSGAQAVTIKDYIYKPASITVPQGTAVTFTNHDTTAHTATSKQSGVFESGAIQPGKSAKITLEKAGTFTYYCAFHPFMKGTIVVE
jgi:plastocyanin